jgi:hypothetical protein
LSVKVGLSGISKERDYCHPDQKRKELNETILILLHGGSRHLQRKQETASELSRQNMRQAANALLCNGARIFPETGVVGGYLWQEGWLCTHLILHSVGPQPTHDAVERHLFFRSGRSAT